MTLKRQTVSLLDASKPLLIADGLIPTTAIAERLLREAYGDVEVVVAQGLSGVNTRNRPVFISRVCHPRFAWFVDYFARNSIPYVYLLDDNFFELTAEYDAFNASFFGHPAAHETLEQFLLAAEAVWLMSRPLESYLQARLPSIKTQFVEAPVDIDLFDRCASVTRDLRESPDTFVVGYPTTRRPNVAALVSEVVRRSRELWGDEVAFEFIGWCPDEVANHPGVKVFSLVADYESFLRLMFSRRWDVAIAPLGNSAFENAKTSLKFREYGAARIPGVYSDCPLFASCIDNGVNGLLASGEPDDWVSQLERLKNSKALRGEIVSAARGQVEARHSQSHIAARLREAFSNIWGKSL